MTEEARTEPRKVDWHRFAWPAAFVIVASLGFVLLRDRAQAKDAPSEVRVQGSNTVVKSLHDLARLETTSLHVEKVIDVRDHQKKLYGLLETEDSLLFIASGEVVIGVDLARLRDEDARFDETTKTATITLPEPEVLYVHSRKTGTLADRNEQLEALARREATVAFEAAGRQKDVRDRAKEQAERQIRSLATAWGAKNVIVTWRPLVPSENVAPAAK
jgi:hypothetical protein